MRRWIRTGLVLLSVSLAQPLVAGAEIDLLRLLSNSGEEGLAWLSSPVQGSRSDYVSAGLWLTAIGVSLNNDLAWYQQIQSSRTPWEDKVMPAISLAGDAWTSVALGALLYGLAPGRDHVVGGMLLEGQLDGGVAATLLKLSFTSTRPSTDPTQRHWFTGQIKDNSFPSGHSMSAFITAVILGRAYHLEWLTYPLASLVAYSRVYNQNHWPSDVVAGAGLGYWIGCTVWDFHQRSSDPADAFQWTVVPQGDGATLVLTWNF